MITYNKKFVDRVPEDDRYEFFQVRSRIVKIENAIAAGDFEKAAIHAKEGFKLFGDSHFWKNHEVKRMGQGMYEDSVITLTVEGGDGQTVWFEVIELDGLRKETGDHN